MVMQLVRRVLVAVGLVLSGFLGHLQTVPLALRAFIPQRLAHQQFLLVCHVQQEVIPTFGQQAAHLALLAPTAKLSRELHPQSAQTAPRENTLRVGGQRVLHALRASQLLLVRVNATTVWRGRTRPTS